MNEVCFEHIVANQDLYTVNSLGMNHFDRVSLHPTPCSVCDKYNVLTVYCLRIQTGIY